MLLNTIPISFFGSIKKGYRTYTSYLLHNGRRTILFPKEIHSKLYIFHKLNTPSYRCFYTIKQLCLFRSFFLIVTQLLVSNNLVNHVFNTICLLSDLICRHTTSLENMFSLYFHTILIQLQVFC